MRPWEREQPSPPPPKSPLRSSKGALSSMVFKPSAEEVARNRDEDLDAEGFAPEPLRPREASPSPPRRPRTRRPPDDSGHELSVRFASPSHHRRMEVRRNDHFCGHPVQPYVHRQVRGGKTDNRPRDHSSSHYRGRGRVNFRDTSPTYARVADQGRLGEYATVDSHGRGRGGFRHTQFGHRGGRSFQNYSSPIFGHEKGGRRDFSPAYGKGRGRGRMRDISPSHENRSARRYHDHSPVYEPERSSGRVRGISPPYGPRKDARIFNRNFSSPESEALPFRDEGATRNNPNIPPRVGDWICRNPLCGNINFARREYCNNCNKFRYEPGVGGHSSSPRHEYAGIPLTLDPLPVMRPVSSIEREIDGYSSSPRRWNRDSPGGPVPRHGGRVPGALVHREIVDDEEDIEYREIDKIGWLSPREWDHPKCGRVELLQERREYACDDNRWVQRERSRSPVRAHLPKDSHHASVGRGRGNRQGAARGRGHNLF